MISDTAVLLGWVFPRADVVEGGCCGHASACDPRSGTESDLENIRSSEEISQQATQRPIALTLLGTIHQFFKSLAD